jgi:hypothetical protein
MLLDTKFCGETQIAGDPQGQYYWEQNSYLEEQPIWPHQQFQQNESLEVESQSHLEEIIKQMAESNLQFQHVQSSLQSITVQVEQLVSTFHQIQQNKMSHDVSTFHQILF